MLKRPLVSAVILIGVGIIFGIALVSSITTGGISSVFAANKEIGAKTAPVNLSSQVQAINEAFANASKAVNATVVNINVITETKVSNNRMQDLFRFLEAQMKSQMMKIKVNQKHRDLKVQVLELSFQKMVI